MKKTNTFAVSHKPAPHIATITNRPTSVLLNEFHCWRTKAQDSLVMKLLESYFKSKQFSVDITADEKKFRSQSARHKTLMLFINKKYGSLLKYCEGLVQVVQNLEQQNSKVPSIYSNKDPKVAKFVMNAEGIKVLIQEQTHVIKKVPHKLFPLLKTTKEKGKEKERYIIFGKESKNYMERVLDEITNTDSTWKPMLGANNILVSKSRLMKNSELSAIIIACRDEYEKSKSKVITPNKSKTFEEIIPASIPRIANNARHTGVGCP